METRPDHVVFVHAHPDDETISTGSTLARLAAGGARVTVVMCTRGERGESIPVEYRGLDAESFAAVRVHELRVALTELGVSELVLLGDDVPGGAAAEARRYGDSGMAHGPDGPVAVVPAPAGSLLAADLDEIVAELIPVLEWERPDAVVTYAADGGYGHPDHVRVHQATVLAAQFLELPLYTVDSQPDPDAPIVVQPMADRKRAALAAYSTQVALDASGDAFRLSSGDPAPVAAIESFRRWPESGTTFTDHGILGRIAACAIAVLLGAFVGVTMTVAHQAVLPVGAVRLPWAIVVAIAVTVALLVGLRIIYRSRLITGCAALGLLATSALLAMHSAGGSVLVPGNPAGYVWTFGPVLIAAVVLAWPILDRQGGIRRRDTIEVPAAKGSELL